MTRLAMLLILVAPVLGGCANPGAPVAAPTGIRAQNGGGERQLGVVGGNPASGGNIGAGGVIATTVVR